MRPASLRPSHDLAADKPHGTRVKYAAGCRCVECRRANTKYELRQAVLRATGRGNGLVAVYRVRRHLKWLSSKGVGRRTVHQQAGVSITTLAKIKRGDRSHIRAQAEKRILAVRPEAARGTALVSGARTWRYINSLLDEGFTKKFLSERLGYKNGAIQFRHERVTAITARSVERLYGELTA